MKLLQVPTANLEERIKEELEENPALEVTDEDGAEYEEKDEFADNTPAEEEYDSEERDQEDLYENIDISDYVQEGDDDIADYKLRDDNYGEQEEKTTMPYRIETSFYEMLENQLGMLNLDDRQYKITEQIIGSIDEDGYLR
ncbi:MAG TPA: RNA polymerase sigma-54 factor, partial [Flavisolibacter sp.]|nr:RNA polymerase sigma-54 factor [Flavisolibacter sp.]